MFWFSRSGFQTLRSLLVIGLLLLIVQLLILDPADRRPFVQHLVLRAVAAVETACTKIKEVVFADSTTCVKTPEHGRDHPAAGPTPSPGPLPGASEQDLPGDFLAELEQAVARTGDRSGKTRWAELCSTRERASKLDKAAKLAQELPPRWWPVDGELIYELDLPAVLRSRQAKNPAAGAGTTKSDAFGLAGGSD
jgi:hypothetical protein